MESNNLFYGLQAMSVVTGSDDSALSERLRVFLQNTRHTLYKRNLNSKSNIVDDVVNLKPDVFLLDGELLEANLTLPRDIKLKLPKVAIFIMVRKESEFNDPDYIKQLMRGAVSDVFQLDDQYKFRSWLEPMRLALEILSKIPDHDDGATGRVNTIHSLKGGVGRSTIAANLAAGIAYKMGLNDKFVPHTLIIDLNWPFGGVENYLNMRPKKSILDLLPVMNNISRQDLLNATGLHDSSRIRLLAAPVPEDHHSFVLELTQEDLRASTSQFNHSEILNGLLDRVDLQEFEFSAHTLPQGGQDVLRKTLQMAKYKQVVTQLVNNVIKAAKRYFDYIVIDAPPVMDEITLAALRASDQILLVSTPDVPSIHAVRFELDLLKKLHIDRGQIKIVVNREVGRSEIRAENVEDLFATYTFAGTLPDDPMIKRFANTSVLAVEAELFSQFKDSFNEVIEQALSRNDSKENLLIV